MLHSPSWIPGITIPGYVSHILKKAVAQATGQEGWPFLLLPSGKLT
jgi:hypothetical protein